MINTEAVNIGIIGGGIRGSMFARGIRENPAANLVALCDPSQPTRAKAAADHSIPVFESVESMVQAHPEITAVIVATPDFAHRDAAVFCAAKGLDLMIEKPLATTVEDAAAINDAADASGARVMVGFENRWNTRFEAVRNLVQNGSNGTVVNQFINLNDTIFVPTKMLSWAAKSSPAWFLMPHSLDLAIWIGGAVPTSVSAQGSKTVLAGIGVDTWDSITATFTMSDGSYVVLNSSWILPESAPAVFDFRYEIQTSNSAFHIDGATHGITHLSPTSNSWPQLGVTERNGRITGVPVDMVNSFVDFLNGTNTDVPQGVDGFLITQAIAAVHESLEQNTPIKISF